MRCEEAAKEITDMVYIRRPQAGDGPAVHQLIAACPPLDTNSLYCNLLQCLHLGSTCIVAERERRLVGFISGYRLPEEPHVLFIWQIAVAPEARGKGLGLRLLSALLLRPGCRGVNTLQATITPSNRTSWALFRALARTLGTSLTSTPLFDRDAHLGGHHESEVLVSIGPFESSSLNTAKPLRRTA